MLESPRARGQKAALKYLQGPTPKKGVAELGLSMFGILLGFAMIITVLMVRHGS